MLIRALINTDGTGLIEGQAGPGSQTLPDGQPLAATFPAGWQVNRDLGSAGWRFSNFNTDALGALPVGHELVGYTVAAGALARGTRPIPLPVLDLPQIRSFVRRAGLEAIYDAAVAAAQASEDEAVRFAADSLTVGSTFHFDRTMAAAAAVIALLTLPEGITPPAFGDLEYQAGLVAHWRAAHDQVLPGAGV